MQGPPDSTRRRTITAFIASPFVVGPAVACSIGLIAALPAMTNDAVAASDAAGATDSSSDARFEPARYKGRIVYLDFWASWCPPCLQSFPWMQSVATRHSARSFSIVAVNLDRDRAAALRFLDKAKPGFNIAFDPQRDLARGMKVAAMPTSFLLDATGAAVYRHEGFKVVDQADLESRIAALLEKRT